MNKAPSETDTLSDWLNWQETLHLKDIDLGLERVSKVLHQMYPKFYPQQGKQNFPFLIITVGGTNGKGSTIAYLNAILNDAYYKTGVYTSPHLTHYNERICINQQTIDDRSLCQSFARINNARKETSLSYFEFGTLAAIDYFIQQQCEVVILEVGLGGRLDAVNVLNADCSIVTTVDFDHQDYLGNSLQQICYEKAGIYRAKQTAIYGDTQGVEFMQQFAQQIGTDLFCFGKDYNYQKSDDDWQWQRLDDKECIQALPLAHLNGEVQYKNISNAIMAIQLLADKLPRLNHQHIHSGIKQASTTGRIQIVQENPQVIVDVAHNPQATRILADYLYNTQKETKTIALFSCLQDKDCQQIVKTMQPIIDLWRIYELDNERAMPIAKIKRIVDSILNKQLVTCYNSFPLAIQTTLQYMNKQASDYGINYRLVIFGSFAVVGDALSWFRD